MVEKANMARQIATTAGPTAPGIAEPKASWVRAAPLTPEFHTPLAMMAMPVKVQTTIVSMKVWVMDTSAWRTGSRVCAAAAAMPAEPSPDSLEKMPRATP